MKYDKEMNTSLLIQWPVLIEADPPLELLEPTLRSELRESHQLELELSTFQDHLLSIDSEIKYDVLMKLNEEFNTQTINL